MPFLRAYLATIVAFIVVDAIWISLFVRHLYRETMGQLLLETPNFLAAGLFYLLYTTGIVVLAVLPALTARSAKTAVINGALLGAVAYGTFALTNFAVFKGWTTSLVISDIAWGTFLTALSASCGYLFARS